MCKCKNLGKGETFGEATCRFCMVLGKSFEAEALSFWIMVVSHGREENNWFLCMIFPFLTILTF